MEVTELSDTGNLRFSFICGIVVCLFPVQKERKTLTLGTPRHSLTGLSLRPEGGTDMVGPLLRQAVLEKGSNAQVGWLPLGDSFQEMLQWPVSQGLGVSWQNGDLMNQNQRLDESEQASAASREKGEEGGREVGRKGGRGGSKAS